jgi:hypothetical protein
MGKPTEGNQKGAQQHAEGTQHGEKAHERLQEQLHGKETGGPNDHAHQEEPETNPAPRLGGHPIFEDRQQHDEADKNADKNRLRKERAAHGLPGDETPSTHGGRL